MCFQDLKNIFVMCFQDFKNIFVMCFQDFKNHFLSLVKTETIPIEVFK